MAKIRMQRGGQPKAAPVADTVTEPVPSEPAQEVSQAPVSAAPAEAPAPPAHGERYGQGGVYRDIGGGRRVRVT